MRNFLSKSLFQGMYNSLSDGIIEKHSSAEFIRGGGEPLKLTYETWVEGMKKANHPNCRVDAYEKFFETPLENLNEVEHCFPLFEDPNLSRAVQTVMQANNIGITAVKWFNYSSPVSPQFSPKSTGIGRTEILPKRVVYFAKIWCDDRAVPFVLSYDGTGMGFGEMSVSSLKTYKEYAPSILSLILKTAQINNIFKNQVVTAKGRFITRPEVSYDDVILSEKARTTIDKYVRKFFSMRDIYKANGIPFKRGVILEGPPGTGKTMLGKAFAKEFKDVTFIWTTANDLSECVKSLFDWARSLTPAVLFIEDIDFFGGSRSTKGLSNPSSFGHSEMGELLAQLDGFSSNDGLLVFATTNMAKSLDRAISNRPGRFDVKVTLGLPDELTRKSLLQSFMKSVLSNGVDFDEVAKLCEGYSPAQLKELIARAVMCAVDKGRVQSDGRTIIDQECLKEAISSWKDDEPLEDYV